MEVVQDTGECLEQLRYVYYKR